MDENQMKEIEEMENIKVDHSYTADDIQVLEGLEAVRKRPGMYIGSTSEKGLHHLVWEIVDNSIDEALAGFATDIDIAIEKDNIIRVEDNGRGMPTGIVEKSGISGVETILPFYMPAVNLAVVRIRYPVVCMVLVPALLML